MGLAISRQVFDDNLRRIHRHLLRAELSVLITHTVWRWLRLAPNDGAPKVIRAAYAFQHEARHFAENLLAFMKIQLRSSSQRLEETLFGLVDDDDDDDEKDPTTTTTAACSSLPAVAGHYRTFARTATAHFFLPLDGEAFVATTKSTTEEDVNVGGDCCSSSRVLAAIGELQERLSRFCELIARLRVSSVLGPRLCEAESIGDDDDAADVAALEAIQRDHGEFRRGVAALCRRLESHQHSDGAIAVVTEESPAHVLLHALNFNGVYI
jgi:hypothetical protein